MMALSLGYISIGGAVAEARFSYTQIDKIPVSRTLPVKSGFAPSNCVAATSVEAAINCGARDTFNHPGVVSAGLTESEWRALLRAMIWRESRFQPHVRSKMGAYGLTQLMPDTARSAGIQPERLKQPYCQVKGGGIYLASMLRTFDGDLYRALAGYNAGPGNVRRYKGIPPFKETQIYVRDVIKKYHEYKSPQNSQPKDIL